MIQRTKKFNVSVLTEGVGFDVFKNFGYQCGRDIDKFSNFYDTKRSNNGVLYITKNTNAYMSAWVKQEIDLGTHIMFIAQLVEAEVLSEMPTVTYDFYQKNIKQAPQKTDKKANKSAHSKRMSTFYIANSKPKKSFKMKRTPR